MRILPALLATGLALVIFLVMGLLIAWGWGRGYSDNALYTQAVLTLIGFAVPVATSCAMLIWTLRGAKVPVLLKAIVLLCAGGALALAIWCLINDPGDAFWMVPPLLGFAGCAIWSVWIVAKPRGATF